MMYITIEMIKENDDDLHFVDYFFNLYGERIEILEFIKTEHELLYIIFLLKNFECFRVPEFFDYIRREYPDHYDGICYNCIDVRKTYVHLYEG